MKPKERVGRVFRGEKVDRVPIYTNSYHSEYIISKLGFSRLEVLTDPEKELKAFLLSQEEFPSDILRVPGDPLLPETSKARRELKYGPDAPPAPRILKDKRALKNLELRDPKKSPSYMVFLNIASRLREMFPDHAIQALAPGPWSNGVELRGPEALIYDTRDDPAFVHELLRYTTELAKMRGLALAERGVDMVILGDPSAGCSLISPKIYEEFVFPYHKEVFSYLKEKTNSWIGLHICGYIDPIMEYIADLPIDWMEIDSPSSLERMVEIMGGRKVIKGNVSTSLFAEGTPEDIKREVKRCIDVGMPTGKFILSPGCRIPWNMKPENMRAFIEAAETYGRVE